MMNATMPPNFRNLDLCPPVMDASLYASACPPNKPPRFGDATTAASAVLVVDDDTDRLRGEPIPLIYDQILGRRRASSAVDISSGELQ